MTESLEMQIVNRARSMNVSDIPHDVVDLAKSLILDQIGVQIACSSLPWVKALHKYVVATALSGPSLALGFRSRFVPEFAALINGTAGHGFELDDYYPPSHTHPSCVAVAASIAVGESAAASGADVLKAYVMAAELIVALAHSTMPSMLYERGFHATCAHGVFGSALASGLLLGMSSAEIIDALGIAGSHASGTTEFSRSGGDVKRLHGGMGASNGVRACFLAKEGVKGPKTILTGERGFLHAFSPEPDPQGLAGFADSWRMRAVITKPFCCNARIIPQIEALASILDYHDLSGDDIEEIRVGTDAGAFKNGSATIGPEPVDIIGMQFSTHFAMALRVVVGSNGFEPFYEILTGRSDRLAEITEVAHRVVVYVDDESQAAWPAQRKAKVSITSTSGQVYEGRATASATQRPSKAGIERKFRELAGRRLPGDAVVAIERMVDVLPSLDDIRELTDVIFDST